MLLLKIGVDDQGNPKIETLSKNINRLKAITVDTGSIMKGVFGGAVMYQGVAMLAGQLGKVTEEATKFEQTLTRIKAIQPESNLGAMSDKARELAQNSRYSQNQIANTALELVKMGKSSSETFKMLPDVINLATASMSDLGWTSTNLISIMNAFRKGTSDTTGTVNIINAALNSSSMNMEDFMEGFKYIAPVASSAGISLKETASVLAFFSNIGVRGSQAGTTFRTMLMNLMAGSKELTAALQGTNVKGMSFVQIIQTLKDKGVSMQEFFKIFDKWAITGAVGLANGNKEYQELLKTINKSPTAEETAQQMMNNIRDQAILLQNAVYDVGISFLKAFGSTPVEGIRNITQKVRELSKGVEAHKGEIQAVTRVVMTLIENFDKVAIVVGSIWAAEKIRVVLQYANAIKGLNTVIWANVAATQAQAAATGKTIAKIDVASLRWGAYGLAAGAALAGIELYIDNINKKLDQQVDRLAKGTNANSAEAKQAYQDWYQYYALRKRIEKDKWGSPTDNQSLSQRTVWMASRYGMSQDDLRKMNVDQLHTQAMGYAMTAFKQAPTSTDTGGTNTGAGNNLGNLLGNTTAKGKGFDYDKYMERVLDAYTNAIIAQVKKDMGSQGTVKGTYDTLNSFLATLRVDLTKEQIDGVWQSLETKVKSTQAENYRQITSSYATRKTEADLAMDLYGKGNQSLFSPGYTGRVQTTKASFDQARAAIMGEYNKVKGQHDVGEINETDMTKVYDLQIEQMAKVAEKEREFIDQRTKTYVGYAQTVTQIGSDVYGLYMKYSEVQKANEMGALQEKLQNAQEAYDKDVEAAGENTYRKKILAEEWAAKQEAIQDEIAAKTKANREEEKEQAEVQAIISASLAAVNALATAGDIYTGITMAIVAEAMGLTYAGIISSQQYRSGTVRGAGNGTSDSVPAMLSRGEVVISNPDVERLGGYDAIQKAIDVGSFGSSRGNITVHIDSVIGTDEYVEKTLIPAFNEALQR
jgi:TP901 family phage tail tape measure protein